MASDTVTTIFGGDDSPFQAVAKRVTGAMKAITSFKPPGDAFKAVHAGFQGVEATAKGAVVGITALKGAFTELLPIVGALAGVTGVVAAFGKAISQAGERETAAQRLGAVADAGENLAGVMEQLEAASAKTGRDFPELAKSVQSFKEAGVPLEAASGYTEKLNEISLVTGKSLEDLTDVFTRMSVKGEASFKDLAKFIVVPGVSQLAKEYKNLEVETGNLERATSKQIELWKREDDVTNRAAAAINSFAQETGIAAATFDAWKKAREGQVFDNSGIPGLGRIIGKQVAEFTTGMKQIEKETGLSELTIKQFIEAGRIGFGSLLSASERYHEEQQKAREQGAQDTLRAQQEALVAKQQGLVSQVSQLVEKGIDPEKLDAYFETFAGKLYQLEHQISETFEGFGTPLLKALNPLLDHLNSDLAPGMKNVADQFGTWLSDNAIKVISAFETGNWSKVGDAFAGALTSPPVFKAVDTVITYIETAIGKTAGAAFSHVFDSMPKNLEEARNAVTAAGLNPFTKEFWIGGFGGVPARPTPVNPNDVPVPNNQGPQTTPTTSISDPKAVGTLADILFQIRDLNGTLTEVFA